LLPFESNGDRFPERVEELIKAGTPALDCDRSFAYSNYPAQDLQLSSVTFNDLNTEPHGIHSIVDGLDQAVAYVFPITTEPPEKVRADIMSAQLAVGIGSGSEITRIQGRIVVPASMAMQIVEYVHTHSGHFGLSNLRRVIQRDYSIKNLKGQCYDVVSRCPICQVLKGSRHFNHAAEVSKWDKPSLIQGSWVTVGLDIYKYLCYSVLTVTDPLSRVIRLIVVNELSSKGYTSRDIANAFDKLCYRTGFGFPSVVCLL
jgi:hypothetical protein